jgi:hypothetical protein
MPTYVRSWVYLLAVAVLAMAGWVAAAGPAQASVTFHHCTSPRHTITGTAANPQNGITLRGYYVSADTWNFGPYPGSREKLYICNFNNWYAKVNVNDNANDGAVKTYPNVHKDYSSPAVHSFRKIASTFAHTAPRHGAWNYAYDIWLNNFSDELMIWTQSHGRQAHVPGIPTVGAAAIGHIRYTIHHTGSYTAYDMRRSHRSGRLPLLAIIKNAINRGLLRRGATLSQIDYGVEVCDTGGRSTKFQVNNFSIASTRR